MIEVDEKGFPIDLSKWPETTKLKESGKGIDLVHRIMKSLHRLGCKCFSRQYMISVEADIFNDIELFKGMDNVKLDIELKEQKKINAEMWEVLTLKEKFEMIKVAVLKGHDYFNFTENRKMPAVVFDDYRGHCMVTNLNAVYTPENSDKSINFNIIVTKTGIEFSDLIND